MHTPAGTPRWRITCEDQARLAAAAQHVFEPETEVLAVYLYGSAARAEPAADLDVALMLSAPMAPARLEALATKLQAQGAPTGAPVDLRPLWGAAPRFQINVIKEGRVLFERDRSERLTSEAWLMSRWADFKPTWEKMRQRTRARWLDG